MTRTMIIGYERTPQGEDSLALGRIFAEALSLHAVVATVMPWPRHLMGVEDLDRSLEIETAPIFDSARERFAPLPVETRALVHPSPAEALFELVETDAAQLVVLGSTHRCRLGHVCPGSVATALLHGAACAVAVAPRGFSNGAAGSPRRIGVAFDGSPEAWAALETAIGLAQVGRADLVVFTVADPPTYGLSASMPTAADARDFEFADKRRVHELALARTPASVSVESRLLHGSAGDELAEASRDVDLVIAGSRAYGPLRRTLTGSTSAKLIRTARCPVIVLPRGALDPLRMHPRQSVRGRNRAAVSLNGRGRARSATTAG